MWSLALASAVGVLAQMGSPPGARTPAPRLAMGFDLMKVKVLFSGLTGVVDAAMQIPTRSKTKSPGAKSKLLYPPIASAFDGKAMYCFWMPATVLGKSRGTCFAASPTRMGMAGLAVSFMQQSTGSFPL